MTAPKLDGDGYSLLIVVVILSILIALLGCTYEDRGYRVSYGSSSDYYKYEEPCTNSPYDRRNHVVTYTPESHTFYAKVVVRIGDNKIIVGELPVEVTLKGTSVDRELVGIIQILSLDARDDLVEALQSVDHKKAILDAAKSAGIDNLNQWKHVE